MNANTALKINDAIDQAVRCGESNGEILSQVHRALETAHRERIREGIKRLVEEEARNAASRGTLEEA